MRDAAFVIPYTMAKADRNCLNIVLGQKEDLLENVSICLMYTVEKNFQKEQKAWGYVFLIRAPR